MFTHKIVTKEEQPNGTVKLGVEFTDGTATFTEEVIPQDKVGFKHWVNSRLTSLNSLEELKEVEIGNPVDLEDPVVEKTAEETERDEWLAKYSRWVRVKTNLIDTGVLTGEETKVVEFLADVKAGFKPDYINFI